MLALAVATHGGATAHADPPLPVIPANSFNITDHGAFGDGISNNAAAIQSTINAAAAAGGGTVVVAAVGSLTNYMSGPLNLSNNVCLQINAGTKLQMFPMNIWTNISTASTPFINGAQLHDVAITGLGTIDGNSGFSAGSTSNWWGKLGSGNPVATRPEFLNINSTTNLLVQGVTLQNPPVSHFIFKSNDTNVTIQGVIINTVTNSPNTDSEFTCRNMVIRNCTITCGDDNLVTSGGDITVSNCTFNSGHGLSIGSSTTSGMNNLLVSNCMWNGTEYGIHMKSARGRGGLVQNLTYRDLTMTNVNFVVAIYSYYDQIGAPSHVINVTPFGASTNGVVVTNSIPTWQNITISNVTASTVGGVGNIAGIIWGLPEVLVSNVTISHVKFADATNTFCVYNAQGIRFVDCNLATPAKTNTFTLYNADVTVTNTVPNTSPVTLGGLAIPPTNNTLAFFNSQAAVTDTNMLGASPITLGGSTLTLNQSSVTFSNNITAASASAFVMLGGNNTYGGSLAGPGPLAMVLTNGSGLRLTQTGSVWGGANAAFDGGSSGIINNHSSGNIAIMLGALSGGSGSTLSGSDQSGAGVDTYVIGSLNSNTTFAGIITNGAQHAVALTKIGTGTFAITGANSYTGPTTVSNGTLVVSNPVGQGTLTVAGGTNTVSSNLSVGNAAGTTGMVWVTGGVLDDGLQTISLGVSGVGQMTVSNGTVLAGVVDCGFNSGSRGTLTMAGGALKSSSLAAGLNNSTGTIWVTGGQLGPVSTMQIGRSGKGQMTVSNGTALASTSLSLGVGIFAGLSQGTLTVAGGSVVVTNSIASGALIVGQADPGFYTQNGGIVTVDNLLATNLANSVFTLNGGTFQTRATTVSNTQQCAVGNGATAATYHLIGGIHSFNNGLRIRNDGTLSGCGTINGAVVVDAGGSVVADCGGSLTFNGSVTNNGTMQAINGSVLESYGPVVNNGLIDITGGTTNFHSTFVNNGSIVGGPAPVFQITGTVIQGNDIFITWATSAGKTNELQASTGGAGGDYNTNNFAAIFTVTNTVGSVTNYLDVGAATNRPSRFYRVRLVP
ncbi:MAG TPA: glycosyl hydrolase family 28 protein [Verrucomicrobiae bacterium]|nr:glycosyl hydrolase family 28 protein [Verrucomicrobiae bacterium]